MWNFKKDEIRLYNCFNGLMETLDYRLFKFSKESQELINAFILDQAQKDDVQLYLSKKEKK